MSADFLPSLYRATLLAGIVITVALALVLQSSIWAGSFFFGVIASLLFLKSQEVFLKRLFAGVSAKSMPKKSPKSIWILMLGKYFLLAGLMAAALHYQLLNLIAFVLGFALLHAVMVIKVVTRRGGVQSLLTDIAPTDAARHDGVRV